MTSTARVRHQSGSHPAADRQRPNTEADHIANTAVRKSVDTDLFDRPVEPDNGHLMGTPTPLTKTNGLNHTYLKSWWCHRDQEPNHKSTQAECQRWTDCGLR